MIAHHIVSKHSVRKKYEAFYEGELDSVFRVLDAVDDTNTALLPRLVGVLRRKRKDYKTACTLFTNYFRGYARLLSEAIMGSGIRYRTQNEDDKTRAFDAFYKDNRMDTRLSELLERTISIGYSGLYMRYDNDFIRVDSVRYDSYYPHIHGIRGINKDIERLIYWVSGVKGEYDRAHYAYVISIEKSNNEYKIRHQVFMGDGKTYSINGERADMLSYFVDENVLDSEGYEKYTVPISPLCMFHTLQKDAIGLGESLLKPIVDKVAALAFLETMAMMELQEHFLSKVAVSPSFAQMRKDGVGVVETADKRDVSYFITTDDGQVPQYVQKSNEHFQWLFKMIQTVKEDIAFETGISFELISKEGNSGQERVQLAKIRQKPFENVIKRYQKELEYYVLNIIKVWWMMTYKTLPPSYTIQLPEVFEEDKSVDTMRIIELYKEGIISHKTALKELYKGYTDDDIQKEIEAIKGDVDMNSIDVDASIGNTKTL